MNQFENMGIGRSLEPANSILQPAWKVDNDMTLRPGEILISVKIININLTSFNEIGDETEFDEMLFRKRIMDIIAQRGKLHNPITGTGGMLFGRVLKMDAQYRNIYDLKPGDDIISLTSLTVTPIRLDKILSVDFKNAQLIVEGQCILFSDSPIIKAPTDLPLKTATSALDEAGAPMRAYSIIQPGDRVLIIGASGKSGALVSYAAHKKLQGSGSIVGLVLHSSHRDRLRACPFFEEVIVTDAADISQVCRSPLSEQYADSFDVVINCVNKPGTELITLITAKKQGTVFFATLGSDYKLAALTAESIGKEVSMIPYTGFMENHAAFTLSLLREYPALHKFLVPSSAYPSLEDRVRAYNSTVVKKCAEIQAQGYIFNSPRSQATLRQALKVARYNSTVLIYGESGTGKEVLATIIHQNSERKSFPMLKINCAAIPESLLESELFGYEKGSFTGANSKGKLGLWEAAQNGTLFLDEVEELPLSFQAKLLRAIQEKEITRVGGISPIKVDVRIIAATNRNLEEMVHQHLFREDLYYRLSVFPVLIDPLRDRREDIIPLANHFVHKYNQEFNLRKTISPAALNLLSVQSLRGNVRELQNIIQQAMINVTSDEIKSSDILNTFAYFSKSATDAQQAEAALHAQKLPSHSHSLKEMLEATEREILLEYCKYYRTTQQLADVLQTSQPTIVRKLQKYGIRKQNPQ